MTLNLVLFYLILTLTLILINFNFNFNFTIPLNYSSFPLCFLLLKVTYNFFKALEKLYYLYYSKNIIKELKKKYIIKKNNKVYKCYKKIKKVYFKISFNYIFYFLF